MDESSKRSAWDDAAAFAELYDALADRLHHYLVSRLGNRTDAADVLQEVFVRLVRDRENLGSVANVTAFTFAIAQNEANRWLDARRRRGEAIAGASASFLFRQAESDDGEARETAEAVVLALACLAPEDREIVELKTYAGLTFREIGQVMGRPLGTVATRYKTALDRMRTRLGRERP